MAENLILGIDLGTTSIKVALVDQKRNTIKENSRDTRADILDPDQTGNHEQDLGKIITALQFCVSGLPKEKLIQVTKIAVTGQMHGVVLWRRGSAWTRNQYGRFEPEQVSKLITWQDNRCSPEFLAGLPKPVSTLRLATGMGCATLFWIRTNQPELLEKFDCAGTLQDYVVTMLCGLEKTVQSTHNAASWGYYDTVQKRWNTEVLETAGFPVNLLPDVVEAASIVGELQCSWYGIPVGTVVGAAMGDLQCSILSSQQNRHDAVLNVSTSAQLAFEMPRDFQPTSEHASGHIQYFPYYNNAYLAVAASLNGGNTMAAFVKMLQQWCHEFGLGVPKSKVWDRLSALGQDCPETDLLIDPTVFGERHNPDARASVTCLTGSNTGLGSVFRALVRGIVTNLHGMMPSQFLIDAGVQRIVGSGSAVDKNATLRQEVEAVYEVPVVFGIGGDAAAGAALALLKYPA